MWTLLNVPMINLSYSTNADFPLKWGHPYNQDMLLVPKSPTVYIRIYTIDTVKKIHMAHIIVGDFDPPA